MTLCLPPPASAAAYEYNTLCSQLVVRYDHPTAGDAYWPCTGLQEHLSVWDRWITPNDSSKYKWETRQLVRG